MGTSYSPHAPIKIRERKFTLNDQDRAQWIDNDEGLYNWWRASHKGKTAFIRENREEITKAILRALHREPKHD